MPRRPTKNITGISRLKNIPCHDVWVNFVCVKCKRFNAIRIGRKLLSPDEAYETAKWKCKYCNYIHSKKSKLPFSNLPKKLIKTNSLPAQRFWQAFFRISTEHRKSYWKQCNVCGRVLAFQAFDRHVGWGPLERQMECRSCKGTINAILNVLRTKEQLHESAIKRRVADMLLKDENERISFKELFKKFDSKCFKTKWPLNIKNRKSWTIDHILPSKYLYPLTIQNAALLSKEANDNKGEKWPSEFYTNSELVKLAKITGADLSLLSNKKPIVNSNIDVDACVTRFLNVREESDLKKRLGELKRVLKSYNLVGKLSRKNKQILGL